MVLLAVGGGRGTGGFLLSLLHLHPHLLRHREFLLHLLGHCELFIHLLDVRLDSDVELGSTHAQLRLLVLVAHNIALVQFSLILDLRSVVVVVLFACEDLDLAYAAQVLRSVALRQRLVHALVLVLVSRIQRDLLLLSQRRLVPLLLHGELELLGETDLGLSHSLLPRQLLLLRLVTLDQLLLP